MPTVAVNPPKTPVTEGSNGMTPASLPNVCKMPGPPAPFVPTPLPNVGQSGNSLTDGSKDVKFEGHKVAIKGSSFKSVGDIASQGTGGGVVSSTVQGKTEWVAPGSMDVKVEGKNVQLLGDAMTNNGGSPPNGARPEGELQKPDPLADFVKELCRIVRECEDEVNDKHFGPGKKPDRAWCNQPRNTPGEENDNNAKFLGREKDECATNKTKEVARRPPFKEKLILTQVSISLGKGLGSCKPDVIVGRPPKCEAVYDFKSSCPPRPPEAGPPDWPTRKGVNQADLYEKACGKRPVMIHPNSEACKQ
jgi:uncharacterized Zn-binding protein involved in type VI secretion